MRLITEFETDDSNYVKGIKKIHGEENIGHEIAKVFGWDERGLTTLAKDSPIKHIYKLEIEAFPMEKWIEFKKRFADALPDYDTVARVRLINALAALEEFHCKPSGDTITNPK